MKRTRLASATLACILVAAATTAGKKPAMPLLPPELEPLIGTWMRIHEDKKKDVKLYIVIKRDDKQVELKVNFGRP